MVADAIYAFPGAAGRVAAIGKTAQEQARLNPARRSEL
jgi:hypothetical protein